MVFSDPASGRVYPEGIIPQSMLKSGLIALLVLMAGRSYAQEDYFVLIQADNNQPFYVHLGDRTFSSSLQGRLTLPQLKEGACTILIGFPKKRFPEQQFSLHIAKKDLEFQLKDLGEKGWGLFNPQTLELKMPEVKDTSAPMTQNAGVKKDDAFSRLMAGVVNDTAVMYNTYALDKVPEDSPLISKGKSQPGRDSLQGAPKVSGITEPSLITSSASSGEAAVLPIGPVTGNASASGQKEAEKSNPGLLPKSENVALAPNANASHTKISNMEDSIKGSLINGDPIKEEPVKGDSIKKDSSKENPLMITDSLKTVSPAPESPISTYNPGVVVKLSERRTAKAMRLVYSDHTIGKKADTIIMIIPLDTVEKRQLVKNQPNMIRGEVVSGQAVQSEQGSSASVVSATPSTAIASAPLAAGTVVPALAGTKTATASGNEGNANRPGSLGTSGTLVEPLYRSKPDSTHKKQATKVMLVNSDCKNFATDYDVDKLRVKMLEAGKDDDRILTARKIFRTKCFTTKQIKALSEVFTSDQLKYRFFETAYPFVSDNHFRELSDLLADPVYNSKFKTMTGQE